MGDLARIGGRELKPLETFEDVYDEARKEKARRDRKKREDDARRAEQARRYRGRPQKLNYDVLEQIAILVRNGATDVTAAQAVGIVDKTFYLWMQRGAESKDGIYRRFFLAVVSAKAQFTVEKELEVGDVAAYWLKFRARAQWAETPPDEKTEGEAKGAIVELVRKIRSEEA